MKKVLKMFWMILILILISAVILILVEYNKAQKTERILIEGVELLQNGQYKTGLERCNQAPYYKVVCYNTLLGLKIGKNETITSDLCENIVLDKPFWSTTKDDGKFRRLCDCMVQYNDKERCKNMINEEINDPS